MVKIQEKQTKKPGDKQAKTSPTSAETTKLELRFTKPAELLAVVRVRGTINTSYSIKQTLESLRLHRNNYCTLLQNNPSARGMLKKVKDLVTWGEISEETLKKLKNKFGEARFYRLSPPRKGYGRKGIKTPFTKSGALGYRREKINDLIIRML